MSYEAPDIRKLGKVTELTQVGGVLKAILNQDDGPRSSVTQPTDT